MRGRKLLMTALESIGRNTLRSALTMLGIVIGIAAVIALVAVGQGAQARIREQIANLGTNLIVITPGSSSQGGVSRGAGSFNRLTVQDADRLRRESTLISAVSPVIAAPSQVVGPNGNWRTLTLGVATDYATIRNWETASGVFFTEEDVRSRRKVVVLGRTTAEALFPGTDPVGQSVRIRGVPVDVIGVLTPKGQSADGSDQDDVVLAPYTTVQTRLSGRSFIAQILATTPSLADVPAAQAEAAAILRESHRLADWEENDFAVRNQSDIADAAEQTTQVMTVLLAAIASISLLVGGIGIMNILLVSVTERTREIGLRLAVGARGSDVMVQFLVESLVMCAIGGAAGIALGAAGAALLAALTGWSTSVSPQAVLVALVFSMAVGLFFGFYPARKAAELNPIEALRYE